MVLQFEITPPIKKYLEQVKKNDKRFSNLLRSLEASQKERQKTQTLLEQALKQEAVDKEENKKAESSLQTSQIMQQLIDTTSNSHNNDTPPKVKLSWSELKRRRAQEQRKQTIEKHNSNEPLYSQTLQEQLNEIEPPLIDLDTMKALVSALNANSIHVYLFQLVESTQIVADRVRPKKRNPVVAARLAALRAQHENRQYAAMVESVCGLSAAQEAQQDRKELRSISSQLSLGVNVLVTMVTCFIGGYWVFSSYSKLIGLIGGLAAMVIALLVEGLLVILGGYQLDSFLEKSERKDAKNLQRTKAFGDR
eukprot:CAMPEP_0201550168 /NCGR_PEP_ID=MMETSP0173_2-20130828/6566_1 /ASSEMBLY_ACC=CAM_ASM_000268 /TAXON_ID=218659 /ORGANISM="Vexillifera sp., Strain DIVA3 564/2" /LENGTH=307 /DNA_ID=CAMNT_0047960073 /DNA_START=26 /DNA_END=949 /DNA_ORIENTATION=-